MSGDKSLFKAEDLYTAEQAAYKAYESRVEEMKRSGQGVLPHDGNNQKMIVSGIISLLASGDQKNFKEEVLDVRKKAGQDPVHYSPLSYALSVAEGYLGKAGKTKRAVTGQSR